MLRLITRDGFSSALTTLAPAVLLLWLFDGALIGVDLRGLRPWNDMFDGIVGCLWFLTSTVGDNNKVDVDEAAISTIASLYFSSSNGDGDDQTLQLTSSRRQR